MLHHIGGHAALEPAEEAAAAMRAEHDQGTSRSSASATIPFQVGAASIATP
jgi:hypothetical protein